MDYVNFSELMGIDFESINFSLSLPKDRKAFVDELDKGGTFLIKFKKVSDGSIRYLTCTRDWDKLSKSNRGYIPPKGLRSEYTSVVTVWDLMDNSFKSFKPETVIQFNRISNDLIGQYNTYIKLSMDEFIDLLDHNELRLSYIKLDGSKRSMRCTRDLSGFKDESKLDTITVYDLDKRDYRNIKFNNVIDYKVNNPYSNKIKKLIGNGKK